MPNMALMSMTKKNDRYTYIEGWWEYIDNWDEYAFVLFDSGHKPDGWQALPPPPEPTGSA